MKSFVLGILSLILFGSILLFGIAFYTVQKYPQQIASEITNHISNEFKDITLSIESVKLIFSPLPKICLNSVIIQTNYGDIVFIDKCLVSPNFIQLIKGNIHFSSIQIIHPTITLKNNELSIEPLEIISNTIKTCLHYLLDVKILIKDGIINLYKQEKPIIEISNLNVSLHISKKKLANISLNISDIHFSDTLPISSDLNVPNSNWSIKNTQIKINNFQLTELPLVDDKHTLDVHTWFTGLGTPKLELSTFISIDNNNHELTILGSTAIQKQSNGSTLLKGQIETEGYFPINNIPTLVQLDIPFSMELNTKDKKLPEISIGKAKLELDNNNLYFNGTIKNYTKRQNILFNGHVQVKRLSLPRWFSFTQELPKGLQHALDSLSGTMDISITPEKIDAQNMHVEILDVKLHGTAGVANLSKPIISFNLKTDTLNINHILPEIKGYTVPPLQYTYTVSPVQYSYIKEKEEVKHVISSDKNTSKNKSIGYDILIHADHADILELNGKKFFLHIYPETNNVKVTASYKDFYSGNIVSSVTISDTNNYTILMNLVNIETQKIVEQITTYHFKGIINGTILSHGKGTYNIKKFLSSLDNTVNLHVKNGTIGLHNKKNIDFSNLYINCNAKGTPINSKEIPQNTTYNGRWNITLLSPTWEGSLTMDGPVNFSTQTWLPSTVNNISSQITFSRSSTPVLQMDGYLSFDLNKLLFTFNKFTNPKKTTLLSGQINVNNNSAFNGYFDISTNEIHKLLSQFGYTSSISQNIKDTHLKGNFSISPAAIQISDTYGVIDQTSFNISLYGLKTNPPTWKVQLNIESLKLDDYLTTNGTHKFWPIEFLHDTHIEGDINIQKIKYKLLKYTKLNIPFNIKKGVLSSNKITASLYGGDTTASITIKALQDKNILMDLQYHSKDIDMLKLTKDREQTSLISGLGIFNLDLQTTGSSIEDLIKNSHGKIQLAIQNGFFKEKTTKVARKFSILSSNGLINKGILTTSNATLTGPGFALKGSGSIDFHKWTIDYNVIVDTNKLSNSIPIHYFGNLSNPQYKINATSFILGTIGSLGNDTLGIIENIFLTPIKLFLP